MPRHPPYALYSLTYRFESGLSLFVKLLEACFHKALWMMAESFAKQRIWGKRSFPNNRQVIHIPLANRPSLTIFKMMYSVTSFGFGWFLNLGLFLGLTYNLSVYVAPRMSKHYFLKNHVLRYFNMQFSKNNVVSDFGIIKLRWMLAFISCFIISKALATCQWATSSAWSFGHNVVDSLSTVEIKGFEPLTPCLQGRCSPNWAIPPYRFLCLLGLPSSFVSP